MKDWELDRIYTWIWAASFPTNESGVKFLIDQNDKLLFNLIQKNNEWKCVMNWEISVSYSKEDVKILEQKILLLENNENKILEFPKLGESEIENIKNIKLELEEKRKNKVEFDRMEYSKIIYGDPANFGVEWLKSLGIEINELSIIGF